MIFNLTYKSILNRKTAFVLSVFAVAISVVLLLGIDRLVKGSKNHFLNTINGTDLIVAAPNGSLDILLNLVFHIGDGLQAIDYSTYNDISNLDEVAWSVPLALGDSFKGYDIVSTNNDYFKHYKFSSGKELKFDKGGYFKEFYDVVIGYNVAKKHHLRYADTIHISHSNTHEEHKHREFRIGGILKYSGTPNDDLVFMQLKTDAAIHVEWQSDRFVDMEISNEKLSQLDIQPKHLSGIMVGLKDSSQVLSMQARIDKYKWAHLKAIIPAKAMSKLYRILASFQDVLMFISGVVFIAALLTMLTSMFATQNERRREIAILRSLGASANIIFGLFASESLIIVLSGIVLGNILLIATIFYFKATLSITLLPNLYELSLLLVMVVAALIASIIPALMSYKHSLQDGLTLKR